MSAKSYDIWIEGYVAQGNSAPAYLMGSSTGVSFKEACDRFFAADPKHKGFYRPDDQYYWGCKLYDNETEARRFNG